MVASSREAVLLELCGCKEAGWPCEDVAGQAAGAGVTDRSVSRPPPPGVDDFSGLLAFGVRASDEAAGGRQGVDRRCCFGTRRHVMHGSLHVVYLGGERALGYARDSNSHAVSAPWKGRE